MLVPDLPPTMFMNLDDGLLFSGPHFPHLEKLNQVILNRLLNGQEYIKVRARKATGILIFNVSYPELIIKLSHG